MSTPPLYRKDGNTEVFDSGATLDINGATVDIDSATTYTNAADATFSGTVTITGDLDVSALSSLDVAKITNADLVIESLNPLTLNLNDVASAQADNADITTFKAADDTNGQAVYFVTANGGDDAAVDGGNDAGSLVVSTGDGGAGGADQTGGDSADFMLKCGDGGDGGAHTSNDPDGGRGGDLGLQPGVGGSAGSGGSGVDGRQGRVILAAMAQLLTNGAPQSIDMADAAVTLAAVPTTGKTEIKSNVLVVDPNSAGAGEDLELPAEALCGGYLILIANSGGENVVVKNDAAATIATIATTELGIFVCDGTSWFGSNF